VYGNDKEEECLCPSKNAVDSKEQNACVAAAIYKGEGQPVSLKRFEPLKVRHQGVSTPSSNQIKPCSQRLVPRSFQEVIINNTGYNI
jgi:hypothetical protein